MNYYSFHIGDYLSATAHLTLLEHGAYRRLLDVYYINEAPLPPELQKVYRLAGARSKDERYAVDCVLNEFFVATDEGYQHDRCDHEIAICNKNRENGKKGGRPLGNKNPANNQNETQNKPSNNPEITQQESPPSPHHPITPSPHHPITPSPKKQQPAQQAAFDARAALISQGVDGQVADDFLAQRKKLRAEVTATALRGIASEAAKAGMSMADALSECCTHGWRGFKACWVEGNNARASPKFDAKSADRKRANAELTGMSIQNFGGMGNDRIEREINPSTAPRLTAAVG